MISAQLLRCGITAGLLSTNVKMLSSSVEQTRKDFLECIIIHDWNEILLTTVYPVFRQDRRYCFLSKDTSTLLPHHTDLRLLGLRRRSAVWFLRILPIRDLKSRRFAVTTDIFFLHWQSQSANMLLCCPRQVIQKGKASELMERLFTVASSFIL